MTTEQFLLAGLLEWIGRCERAGDDYARRNQCVIRAVAYAQEIGYEAGFRIDPKEPEWPVAFIELPTGQVSWHLPQHTREWDGHSTDAKYERVSKYIRQLASPPWGEYDQGAALRAGAAADRQPQP